MLDDKMSSVKNNKMKQKREFFLIHHNSLEEAVTQSASLHC